MALPDFFHTPERIIHQALRDAGRLQFGATPTPEQYEDAMMRLADLITVFQVDGIKLWLNNIRALALTEGQITYTVDTPRELRIVGGWYVRTVDGNRQPLTLESHQSYRGFGTLTTKGRPVAFFPDKRQSSIIVSIWPAPDATSVAEGSIELLCQTEATSPVTLDEAIAFPPEWYMALRWGLADEFASGQPIPLMERCERKAAQYKEKLENWDVEDGSTYMVPDLAHQPRSHFSLR